MRNFGRFVEVMVGGMKFSMADYAIEGTVPFDDDPLPNEAQIKIWNLKTTTVNKIKRNSTLTVNAGYKGDVGVILSGRVSSVRTVREGIDQITTIHVLDGVDLSKREVKDISFKNSTLASYIIKSMAAKIGLPIAQFDLTQDYRYTEGYTANGSPTEIISKVAEDCKTSVYINKGKLYIRSLKHGRGQDKLFQLSADSGLIGIPEYQKEEHSEGYRLTSQLQYRITTASAIDLKSESFTGRLYVRSGAHTFSRTGDFVTSVETVL